MTLCEFSEFWRRLRYRVLETNGCFWYAPERWMFQSLSFHRAQRPSRADLLRVFWRGPALLARFQASSPEATVESGIFRCSNRQYDLDCLEHKTRNQTRRALENCTVEQVEFRFAAKHGYVLNTETFHRQGRRPQRADEASWLKYCGSASLDDDFEAWGAFVEGQLAALAVGALLEECFVILHQSCRTKLLKQYPNNALAFTLTKSKLCEDRVASVSYGLRSVEQTPGLDRFKLNMGYHVDPALDCVALNPGVRPLAAMGRWVLRHAVRRDPDRDLWRKGLRALEMGTEQSR